jgi:hypothetical protein
MIEQLVEMIFVLFFSSIPSRSGEKRKRNRSLVYREKLAAIHLSAWKYSSNNF